MDMHAPMKKTAAIRRAREAVPTPFSLQPPQFIVRMPSDVTRLDSEPVDVVAQNYLEAQHVRSSAISRIAMALMGLTPLEMTPEDGGTIESMVDKAVDRAMRGDDQSVQLWQVQFGSPSSPPQFGTDVEAAPPC